MSNIKVHNHPLEKKQINIVKANLFDKNQIQPDYIEIEICDNCERHEWCYSHSSKLGKELFEKIRTEIQSRMPGIKVVQSRNPFPNLGKLEIRMAGKKIYTNRSVDKLPEIPEICTIVEKTVKTSKKYISDQSTSASSGVSDKFQHVETPKVLENPLDASKDALHKTKNDIDKQKDFSLIKKKMGASLHYRGKSQKLEIVKINIFNSNDFKKNESNENKPTQPQHPNLLDKNTSDEEDEEEDDDDNEEDNDKQNNDDNHSDKSIVEEDHLNISLKIDEIIPEIMKNDRYDEEEKEKYLLDVIHQRELEYQKKEEERLKEFARMKQELEEKMQKEYEEKFKKWEEERAKALAQAKAIEELNKKKALQENLKKYINLKKIANKPAELPKDQPVIPIPGFRV